MNPILKNILAVIAGLVGGSIVNMMLISINGTLIPLPEGVDISNTEKLKEAIKSFEMIHFLAPFLGHAGGTLVGAFIVALIAHSHKLKFSLLIGILFLIGGIINIIMLGSPIWYAIVDLVFAYIPMGWFGYKLSLKFQKK